MVSNQISFLNSRNVYLIGEVNEEMLLKLANSLEELNQKSDSDDIYVNISTYGGDCYVGIAIYELLRSQKARVITTGLGYVFSSGVFILQSGDLRRSYRSTRFMVHEVADEEISGQYSFVKAEVGELDTINKIYRDVWGFKSMPKSNKYLSSEEALELGLLDEILP